jgi:hypothetical protein
MWVRILDAMRALPSFRTVCDRSQMAKMTRLFQTVSVLLLCLGCIHLSQSD